jgi:hypothetical protein
MAEPKKRGRPPTGIVGAMGMRFYTDEINALDAWLDTLPDRKPGRAELIRRCLRAALVSLGLLDDEVRKELKKAGWEFTEPACTWNRPPLLQAAPPVVAAAERPKPKPSLVSTVAPSRRRVGA